MRSDVVSLRAVLGVIAVTCLAPGCGEVPPKKGTPESEIVRRLGKPDRVLTDRSQMNFYLFDQGSCAREATKVLFYERWLGKDLSVAIDTRANVLCTAQAFIGGVE